MSVGRREALGVRQLAAALFYAQPTCLEPYRHDVENNVSVPIWHQSIAPLIPMVSYALPRMQWALEGAKRLECGSLLPLCLMHKQRVCPHIGTYAKGRPAPLRTNNVSVPTFRPPA
ncbi:MAG: hypothetical protein GX456_06330 [Verrucomicrobia bacterium]|nr:hypothetical protein [Verrucomicrobiota bacterium]